MNSPLIWYLVVALADGSWSHWEFYSEVGCEIAKTAKISAQADTDRPVHFAFCMVDESQVVQ